jgi:hypothetical protein
MEIQQVEPAVVLVVIDVALLVKIAAVARQPRRLYL